MATAKQKSAERAKKIEQGIKIAYDSLETHLMYTHSPKGLIRNETHTFHKKCVKEYATLIAILAELY